MAIEILDEAPAASRTSIFAPFRRRLVSLRERLAQMNSFDQGYRLLHPLTVEPARPGETADWSTIEAHLKSTCPELLEAMTGTDSMN